jgi:ribosomal protein S18 acetylase RimI-like enzyme
MSHLLDRPIWNALNSRHAALSEGNSLARRYAPSIHPFASPRDASTESFAALAAIVRPGETILNLQREEMPLPAGFALVDEAAGVQMVADRALEEVHDDRIVRLGEADAVEMLDLATLTKPGPFTLRAQALGDFWGVRENGRLIAMAGERLKQEGWAEVSGVCTHPDARGRGLGKLLTLFVAGKIEARGEKPFLHTYAGNATAIALYERIGFRLRSKMHVMMLKRGED